MHLPIKSKRLEEAQRWLYDHPAITVVLILCAIFFISLPQWGASVWQLFTEKPFFVWLSERIKTVQFSAYWITVPFGLLVILAILYLLITGRARLGVKESQTDEATTEPPATNLNAENVTTVEELTEQLRLTTVERNHFEKARDEAIKANEEAGRRIERLEHNEAGLQMGLTSRINELEQHKWLLEIAKRDKSDMRQLVHVKVYEPVHYSLECGDAPYIEFVVKVRNASVYPISVEDDVKNRISYREPNYLLSATPTITENRAKELQHGYEGIFRLYQSLAPHECELIRKYTKENPKQPTYTTVNLEKVSIYFTVDFQDGTSEKVKLELPSTADLPKWY